MEENMIKTNKIPYYDEVLIRQINIQDDGTSMTIPLSSNTLYVFEDRTSNLTIQLAEPISGIANEYHCFIIVGNAQPTITWDIQNLTWSGGSAPGMSTGKTYEISIINNIGIFLEV